MRSLTSGRLAVALALLALIVAMGGTGYAAGKISGKQIKKNAITSAKVKNDSLTGKDIKEATLGQVPSAATAGHASSADNASTVGGVGVTKVNFRVPDNSGTVSKVVFSGGGLTITATCVSSTEDVTLSATTSKAGSYISTYVSDDSTSTNPIENDLENSGFNPGTSFDLNAGGDGNDNRAQFDYSAGDGAEVYGEIVTDEVDPACFAGGFVFSG